MANVKKKRIVIVFLVISGVFGALQFLNASLEKKPVTRPVEAPQEVIAVLENSCFNCHSNQQNLSWFDKIAPVSWLVGFSAAGDALVTFAVLSVTYLMFGKLYPSTAQAVRA